MSYSVIEIDDNAQIIENVSADQAKKYVYLARALPIENVVFSGGGAKGVVYPGVIQALEGQAIKHVAGSSIGAVTAALYASGMSGLTFEEITTQQDFKALLGSLNPHLKKTGEPLLTFLRKNIPDSILTRLKSANADQFAERYQSLKEDEKKAIHKLLNDTEQKKSIQELLTQIKDPSFKITTPVTFAMLGALNEFNEVAGINGAFKNLSVTAVNIEQKSSEPYIFNPTNTPHLEVAKAVRASASLPVMLEPVEIDSESLGIYGKEGKSLRFIDGGFLDNIPVAAVDAKQKKEWGVNLGEQGQNLQTLAFVFDETTEKAYTDGRQSPFLSANEFKDRDDLYVPGLKDIILRNIIPKIPLISGIKTKTKNTVAKARGLKQINTDFTQRNVPLIVEGIQSTSFDQAKAKADDLIATSKAATLNYLNNHDEEAIYLTFDSPVAMLLAMPVSMLQKLLDDKKNVYGLATTDVKAIATFRTDVGTILQNLDTQSVNTLRDVSRYLATEATLHEGWNASYSEYIVDQLHAHKTAWNDIIKNKAHLPAIHSDLMNAIDKRDAQDKLLSRKYELARWLDQEIGRTKSNVNADTLTKARDKVIGADNFAALSAAIEDLKNDYLGEAKKITMLSLLKKPSVVSRTDKYAISLDKDSLMYDAHLLETKQSPVIKPAELTAKADETINQTKKKTIAVVDADSLLKSKETTQAILNNLKENGITDIYFLAPISPNSLTDDMTSAKNDATNQVSPQPLIKEFQNEGFNVTVVTPMDSQSDEIKMGYTYRYGIQPEYDRRVSGSAVIQPKEERATARALDTIAYENLLRKNLAGQERTVESITQIMQKKLSSNMPDDVASVIYVGKGHDIPKPFLAQNKDITFYAVDAHSSSLEFPKLDQETKPLSDVHFANNELWKDKFAEILTKINDYASSVTDANEKAQLENINQIKTMHGSYEEKSRLAIQAFEQYQVANKVKSISDPLEEIKKHLDDYINQYGKGIQGLYTKLLSQVKSDDLRVQKLEFAKRQREHIKTLLLSQKRPDRMNDVKLQHASQSLINIYRKNYENVYKGNEADKQSTTCPFKQCIDKIDKEKGPMEKLAQALKEEPTRHLLR